MTLFSRNNPLTFKCSRDFPGYVSICETVSGSETPDTVAVLTQEEFEAVADWNVESDSAFFSKPIWHVSLNRCN